MSKKIKAEEYSKWDKNLYKELTPLEALEDLSKLVFIYGGREQYQIVEKALKALEIVKEQNVNTWAFQESKNAEEYNLRIEYNRPQPSFLTQEEYDLLKEVLL